MKFYKTSYMHRIYSGHCISVKQDVHKIVNILPRSPENYSFMVELPNINHKPKNPEFKVDA
jgi:hypothetical protein